MGRNPEGRTGNAGSKKPAADGPSGERHGGQKAGVMVLMGYRPLGSLIRTMLENEGIDAWECASPAEAVDGLIPGSRPVVILDPAEFSWEDLYARELLRCLGDARIVAFTALSAREQGELPLKCAAIVAKTADLEPLISAVKRVGEY